MAPPRGCRLDVLPALIFVPYQIRLVLLVIPVLSVWKKVAGNIVPVFAMELGSPLAMVGSPAPPYPFRVCNQSTGWTVDSVHHASSRTSMHTWCTA